MSTSELLVLMERAHDAVVKACKNGGKFSMHVPVEEDDLDVLVGSALRHAKTFLKALDLSELLRHWQSDIDNCFTCGSLASPSRATSPCAMCLTTAQHIGALQGMLERRLKETTT